MSDAPILEVRDLSAGYGRSRVLFDVSLAAPRTGAVAILGRNGAGKTTLLKTIIGEIQPMGGEIGFDGRSCAGEGTEHRIRRGLGYVPQEQAVFGSLTVRENLTLGAMAQSGREGFDLALDFFPKLAARLSQQAGTLSGGERKMLAIGRAILGRPRLLLLDEPTEGVWVGVIEEIAERLQQLAREISLVVVEQHVELALRVAGHAYVMDRGGVALAGSSEEIRKHPDLVRYLAPQLSSAVRIFSSSDQCRRQSTTALRWLLGFDGTARELALSFGAALFVIGFVAPGLAELLRLGPEGSSMFGALLGMVARPLIEAVMQLARGLREDARGLLRAWISRRWD